MNQKQSTFFKDNYLYILLIIFAFLCLLFLYIIGQKATFLNNSTLTQIGNYHYIDFASKKYFNQKLNDTLLFADNTVIDQQVIVNQNQKNSLEENVSIEGADKIDQVENIQVSNTIDSEIPTATIRLGITEDTYAESGYPYASPWDTRSFLVGYDNQWQKQKTRSYLKYSLDEFTNYEIFPRDIVSAELKIWQYFVESDSEYEIKIGIPNSSWSQINLNWFNQPTSQNYYSYILNRDIGQKNLDITDLLYSQLSVNNWDRGLSISATDENAKGGIFWSNACLYTPDLPRCEQGQEPVVIVKFHLNVAPTKAGLLYPLNVGNTPAYIDNRDVIFNWESSYDPNQDEVKYFLEISDTQDFSNIIYSSEGLTDLNHQYTFGEDGLFFWRVKAEDNRIKNKMFTYSEIAYFEVDTTAPDIPLIDFKPPVIFGKDIVISWQFNTGSESNPVTFSVIKICYPDAENIICEEKNTTFLNEIFTNEIEDAKFCYKVLAQDHLGHKSEYSNTVCAQHDFTPPIFTDFAINQQYISPSSSPTIQDELEISYSLKETNLINARLIIENNSRVIMYDQPFDEIEGTRKPDIKTFPEGNYVIYASAQDIVGQISLSEMIPFIIDNTPPLQPIIVSPSKDLLTNQNQLKLDALVDPYAFSNINIVGPDNKKNEFKNELNSRINKIISEETGSLFEGINNIEIISQDKAGNTSKNNRIFTTDWTNPSTPKILFYVDDVSRDLFATVTSEGADQYYIYNLAGLHTIADNDSGRILLVDNWSGNSTYSFTAISRDKAGNFSDRSEIFSYNTPSVKGATVFGIGSIVDPLFKPANVPTTSECKYRYQVTDNVLSKISCTLSAPTIEKNYNYSSNKEKYLVRTYGADNDKISLSVEAFRCKKKNLFDPRTWFKCFEEQLPTKTNTIETYGAIYGNFPDSRTHFAERETINNTGVRLDFFKGSDYSGQKMSIEKEVIFSQKIGQNWLDFRESTTKSNELPVSNLIYNPIGDGSNKYFRFPFDKIVGVTQWHGYTAFQSPHMGIDFGVYREPIYAIADGYIGYVGWDNSGTKCLTGGNMIKIVHDNGMSSLYAHLENYKKSDGSDLVYGERVKKGDLIGLSGNSGYYNCEPLGYHLHFELRKDQWQSSHINPTDWIDVDWSAINTLNADWYPGRLTGDNPHPEY